MHSAPSASFSGENHRTDRDRPRAAPLDGITVLDLSIFLAGPFCTQILADLGAQVIKVESVAGDPTRALPPYEYRGESAYFLSANRNKQSIVLDLRNDAGVEILGQLAMTSDVVVENFRPGVAARLGADWISLSDRNPSLVGCSISGFGQTGPYAMRPAYDMVIQAVSGGMSITGERGGRPVRSGLPVADLNAGQFAALAIAAALFERERSGLGQNIDVSMLDVQISMLSYQAAYHLVGGAEPGPQGRDHDSIPTYAAFLTRDRREVLVCANTEQMWAALAQVLDLRALTTDFRYATNKDRYAHRDTLQPALAAAFALRDAAELLEALHHAKVPARSEHGGPSTSRPAGPQPWHGRTGRAHARWHHRARRQSIALLAQRSDVADKPADPGPAHRRDLGAAARLERYTDPGLALPRSFRAAPGIGTGRSVITDWARWTQAASPWVDLTRTLDRDAPRVDAFPAPSIRQVWTMPQQVANVTALEMWCHVGTHIDAPLHFFPTAPAAHELPLARLTGPGVVLRVDVEPGAEISLARLQACRPSMRPGDLVLIDSQWANRWGTSEYLDNPHLATDAAEWLVANDAVLVGVDFATPDLAPARRPEGFDFPVHHVLLGNGVLIAEHLADLTRVSGHRVDVVCAPLPIRGGDGAPSRVLARIADDEAGSLV